MNLVECARKGVVTDIMKSVAVSEGVSVDFILKNIASGRIVVPISNINYDRRRALGIGYKLRTKVNVNIGASPDVNSYELECEKLDLAVKHKTDAVMDLSIGPQADKIRNMVIDNSPVSVGTVPIYEVFNKYQSRGVSNIKVDDIFSVIEDQVVRGVDFITVHCGVTKRIVEHIKDNKRVAGIVSRGGAIMAEWILKNDCENPLFEYYDKLLGIAKKYDVTLSLGDGLRPGCIADATDFSQIEELKVLGYLTGRAQKAGVQVMVEGPGHVPINQIKKNMKLQKKYCNDAPFYVLGPLVTDVAPGYDHITSAIGGAIAATHGADFLCYVTPAEHLRLPDASDVVTGLISSRIAAHAADVARGIKGASDWDLKMSVARKNLDWDLQERLAIDPTKVKDGIKKKDDKTCSMCGEFCSMKRMNECL